MKSFSREHKEQLSKLNVEEFKKQCVKDLKSLELGKYGYPPIAEKIIDLVEDNYTHIKKYYGLETQKEIKIALIAIHFGGVRFLEDREYNNFLQNKNITNKQKMEFLEGYIDKRIDLLDERMSHE